MQSKRLITKASRPFAKHFTGRREKKNSNFFFSMPNFVGLLSFVLLCVSCAATSVDISSQEQVLTGNDNSEELRTTEANDTACSYFYFLWGKTAENNGRFEEALEAFEKALLCDEYSKYLKQSLAILLIKMDRKKQAVSVLEQIISSNSQDTENRVLLAKVYTSMGLTDKAVSIYQGLLEIKEDHDTLLMLGSLYAQNKEYAKAQQILNRLIELESDSYLAYYSLARLYRELQYYEQAAASYEKALALNWFERLAYEAAEFYEEQQKYDEAIVVYNRIIDEGQSSDMAKTRLVNLYLKLGENDEALSLLRELRSIMPESHNVDITISRILLSQEKYAEAIMILEDVLQTNPELTVIRYLLGMAYYQDNNYQKAEELLEIIPPESHLYEDTIFLRLKMLNEGDNQEGAIKLLQQQIKNDSTRRSSFYILLASIYRENNGIEQGREIYEQAMGLYPDDVDLLYNYGIFFEKIGEQENAMVKMQAVLALDPENGAALNYVGYTWADNNVHLEQALEYIKKAVELMPDDGYIRDSLGWVYYKLNYLEEAIVELKKASELVADDPIIHEHLGDVYLKLEQFDKAVAAYKEAYKLYQQEEEKKNVNAKINSVRSRSGK